MNTPELPRFEAPAGGDNTTNPDSGVPNQISNAPRLEREKAAIAVAARARHTRKAANTIITTRKQFKEYLRGKGLDLFTSAVEFQKTGSFILSSYVVYPQNEGLKEPLAQFLSRYPQLKQTAENINTSLKGMQQNMQVFSANKLDLDSL